ncbi:hypothetical protein EMIT0P294_20485 [Pseudomonas sp. IT-P294]
MPQQRHPINSKIFTAYSVIKNYVKLNTTTIYSKKSYIKKSDFRQKFFGGFCRPTRKSAMW